MIKNVLKRQTLIITITVITLCIGLLGVSYAVFFSVDDGKEQKVTSGDLVIQFQESSDIITTAASTPISDGEGQKSSGYTFSVTNVGSLPMIYDIYLYDDPDAKKTSGVTMIPHEHLKVKLDNGEVKKLSELEAIEGNTITDNDITKIKINNSKLTVTAKGTDTNVKAHTIRIWIDEKAPESIIGNTIALQLEVFGEVGEIIPFNNLIKENGTNIIADGTKEDNLRYVGASNDVDNYIWFNCNSYNNLTQDTAKDQCEKWRIIGLFNNMTTVDENGNETTGESLVKIIRNESIGNIVWDDNNSNDWTNATLNDKLNNETTGYISSNYIDNNVKGITVNTKSMIEKVKWNLGGWDTDNTASIFYEKERGNTTSQNLLPTTWSGYIGLIYPSDYGYAAGNKCLNTNLYEYNSSCKDSDWLYNSADQWTLTPITNRLDSVFNVYSEGRVSGHSPYLAYGVRPSLYLSSKVGIKEGGGTGEATQPYILEVAE